MKLLTNGWFVSGISLLAWQLISSVSSWKPSAEFPLCCKLNGIPLFWRHFIEASQFLCILSLRSRAIMIFRVIEIDHQVHQIYLWNSLLVWSGRWAGPRSCLLRVQKLRVRISFSWLLLHVLRVFNVLVFARLWTTWRIWIQILTTVVWDALRALLMHWSILSDGLLWFLFFLQFSLCSFFPLLRMNFGFDFLTLCDWCKHSDDDLNMSDQFNDWNINLLLILNACFFFFFF